MPFPFLKLPAEICNMVYKLLFPEADAIPGDKRHLRLYDGNIYQLQFNSRDIWPDGGPPAISKWQPAHFLVALLRANRVIHSEAAGVLYGSPNYTLVVDRVPFAIYPLTESLWVRPDIMMNLFGMHFPWAFTYHRLGHLSLILDLQLPFHGHFGGGSLTY